jgi:ABC-type Fe3+ transport system permease subunit
MNWQSLVALAILAALVCIVLGIMIHWWRSRRKSREEWEQAKVVGWLCMRQATAWPAAQHDH